MEEDRGERAGKRERKKSDLIESLYWELPKLGNPSPPYKLVVSPSQVQPTGPTLEMHNWRRLWESPIKPWFGRDSSKGKMSEGRSGDHAESRSVGSSRGSIWWEWRQKRREDRECEREEEQSGLREGSYQTLQTVSGPTEHEQHEERDREIERLCRLMRDFELEVRNRRQWRDQENQRRRDDNMGDRDGRESIQSGTRQRRDRSQESRWHKTWSYSWGSRRHRNRSRSRELRRRSHSYSQESRWQRDRSHSNGYADWGSNSPEDQMPYNAAMDAMSWALRKAAQSPFSEEIEWAPIPSRFTWPPFNSYNGRIDPVEHVSHYIHMMSLHTHNDALMCKVFPLSLGPMALR